MEIESGAPALFQASVRETCGDMGLEWRFIFRKSRVPIDTIEADFGVGDDLGGK